MSYFCSQCGYKINTSLVSKCSKCDHKFGKPSSQFGADDFASTFNEEIKKLTIKISDCSLLNREEATKCGQYIEVLQDYFNELMSRKLWDANIMQTTISRLSAVLNKKADSLEFDLRDESSAEELRDFILSISVDRIKKFQRQENKSTKPSLIEIKTKNELEKSYCRKCGEKIDPDSNFCVFCGTKVSRQKY